eukprot:scaffold481679_cov37-Prasinocladus_malaysianus.AAC.3
MSCVMRVAFGGNALGGELSVVPLCYFIMMRRVTWRVARIYVEAVSVHNNAEASPQCCMHH